MTVQTEVQSFYKGKTVFVTGATGFAGKSLVQRLLQTCDTSTIYVLLRGKRGQDFAKRLETYLNDNVFSTLADRQVKLSKIRAVEGDMAMERLGLSDQDIGTLRSSVNIVIHGAATIKFNENLKLATRINVFGTLQVLQLCQTMSKLDCMVHVSTFSAWLLEDRLDERINELDINIDKFMAEIQSSDDIVLEQLTSKYVGKAKYPNSYIFTKTMAEVLIKRYATDLKVAVVRLPFIGTSWKEPFQGWFDTLQILNALFCAYTTGFLRFTHISPHVVVPGLPVDVCSNALIVTAWDMATTTKPQQTPYKVYNAVKPLDQMYSMYQIQELAIDCTVKYPSIKQVLLPVMVEKVVSSLTFWILSCLVVLFARAADLVVKLKGTKKPIFGLLAQKLFSGIDVILAAITKLELDVEINNMEQIYSSRLAENDRQLFYYDVRDVVPQEYATAFYMFFRRTVLKEPDSNIPKARKRIENLYRIYRLVKYVCISLAVLVLYWLAG